MAATTNLYNALKKPEESDNLNSVYNISLKNNMTLSMFVKDVLANKDDSGIILVSNDKEPLGEYLYKNGFIISTPNKRYMSCTIKSASIVASGSRKDYLVIFN